MTSTLEIPDDIWFLCIFCLTPLDLTSFCVACNHFNKLTDDTKYDQQMNNYWKIQCEKLWSAIKQPNYKCTAKDYHSLFQSIANFTTKHPKIFFTNCKTINISRSFSKSLRIKAYNMKIWIDDIDINPRNKKNMTKMLSCIITDDQVEMFKICLSSMSDEDIKTKYFDFGKSDSIWDNIIKEHANKIGKYILTDEKFFKIIDLSSSNLNIGKDTLLTYSCYHNCDKIVSLLLKHPNMTKECINTSDAYDFSPLHCVCTTPTNDKATKEKALKIGQMLLDDDRVTHLNTRDYMNRTPLMHAIKYKDNEMVKLLLSKRNKIDCDETTLDFAKEHRASSEVEKLIKEHICNK